MATRKTPALPPSATQAAGKAATAPRKRAKPAAKAPAKAARKPAAKPVAKAPAQPPVKAPLKPEAAQAVAAKEKTEKARKPKMVRDSFTMPKAEYAALDTLKARAAKAGRPAKKSELLRAGVKLLEGLTPAALLVTLQALPAIKTGRPAKA